MLPLWKSGGENLRVIISLPNISQPCLFASPLLDQDCTLVFTYILLGFYINVMLHCFDFTPYSNSLSEKGKTGANNLGQNVLY